MRFLGMTENGIYIDDCDGLLVEDIEELYGVEGDELHRRPSQTGAGHASDENTSDSGSEPDDDDWEDIPNEDAIPAVQVQATHISKSAFCLGRLASLSNSAKLNKHLSASASSQSSSLRQ